MDGYGVETALLAYAASTGASPGGIRSAGRWYSGEADARVFVRRLPRFAADRRARDPGDVRVLAGGGHRHRAARRAAGGLAGARMRVAAAARRSRCSSSTARPSPRALAAYDARWPRRPAVCPRPTRPGWPPGCGAVALGAGRARPKRWRCSIARSPAATASSRRSPTAPSRSEGLGRAGDAVAAWDAVIARAGDSPLGGPRPRPPRPPARRSSRKPFQQSGARAHARARQPRIRHQPRAARGGAQIDRPVCDRHRGRAGSVPNRAGRRAC